MSKPVHIAIGLLRPEISWELLLDQIGVAWFIPGDGYSILEQPPAVIIVNGVPSPSEEKSILQYIDGGGAVLYTPSAKQDCQRRASGRRYLKSLTPENRKEYRFTELFDLYQKVFVFDNGALTALDRAGNGWKAYLGIDVTALYNNHQIRRKDFYTDSLPFPNERVALTTKNSLRQLVQSFLEFIHRVQSIPFVHKWYFPDQHRSLFTFRIDSDKGTQEQIEALYRLSEHYRIPTTWFLDVKSHEQWLPYFRTFSPQEIGVHCYDHTVYRSSDLNSENFAKAKLLLEKTGLHPQGIAAPTGAWSRSIGQAVKENGFEYSSEFGYDYDSLPSFPLLDGSPSPVVQLPVHPVCIGSMVRARMTVGHMIAYYKRVIDQKIDAQEPVCLYHHPTHGHNEVFEEVFRYINSLALPTMTFSAYGAWWKRRARAHFQLSYASGELTGSGTDTELTVRVMMPDGTESLALVSDRSLQTKRTLPARQHITAETKQLLRTRSWSLRRTVQDLLDWWIKVTE